MSLITVPGYTEGKPHSNPPDFSLILGGPFFRLLRRAHLADDALMLVRRRVIFISLLAWLPLLVLSLLQDQLLGGDVTAPFLLYILFAFGMPFFTLHLFI
jgi:hypothetical protein